MADTAKEGGAGVEEIAKTIYNADSLAEDSWDDLSNDQKDRIRRQARAVLGNFNVSPASDVHKAARKGASS